MDIRTLISVASTVAKVGHGLCKMDSEIEMEKYLDTKIEQTSPVLLNFKL